MLLTLENLSNKKKARKRIGRGNASGHGTYSTRGQKGQRSRSGGGKGLKLKGMKKSIMALPKFKGMKRRYPENLIVKLSVIEKNFPANSEISPASLLEKGMLKHANRAVKILADKEIKTPYEIKGCLVSVKAGDIIEKSGGKISEK
jgi:large subunit ribosomal protein L15